MKRLMFDHFELDLFKERGPIGADLRITLPVQDPFMQFGDPKRGATYTLKTLFSKTKIS